jgi:hypothetical protein
MPHQSFRSGGHLPNNREHGLPSDPAGLPRQRAGITPQMHGRYPDYDVLANARHWDEVTRKAILSRVEPPPPLRFFSAEEAAVLGPLVDVMLAQDAEPRIPVLGMVDAKFHSGQLDGYRHADLPEDPETWRRVAAALIALDFDRLSAGERFDIVSGFADGELEGLELDAEQAWSVLMRAALSAFYSHPWAWNEIGFGGPAYPRGYMRLQPGPAGREPDEAEEAFDVDPVPDVDARGEG